MLIKVNNKTKYTIYPDRIYILEYEQFTAEVLGSEILGMLYGSSYLDYELDKLEKENDQSSEIG